MALHLTRHRQRHRPEQRIQHPPLIRRHLQQRMRPRLPSVTGHHQLLIHQNRVDPARLSATRHACRNSSASCGAST